MSLENIPPVIDRILVFASQKSYALVTSLELTHVLPHFHLPNTHCRVLCRFANAHDLGLDGHLDQLRLLVGTSPPLLSDAHAIATGAAAGDHVHILDWLITVRPTLFLPPSHPSSSIREIVQVAIRHGRVYVLDWLLIHRGADTIRSSNLDQYFAIATEYCQLGSLDWLKGYAIEHGLEYHLKSPFDSPPCLC
ncbi:hypothetical protein BC828DRAFT_386008 [Blastocladiella britannica]|nr:hypothetical protein BC828DRAFT_386008 [Blastocladiella britannica]